MALMGAAMFEVHHFTLLDGWVNTWLIWDEENDDFVPEQFGTEADAQAALDDFFSGLDREQEYSRGEFKIVQVQP
jgi:hypothetical protein